MIRDVQLTIVIPGIRTNNWIRILEQIRESCSRHTFEIIFSSPEDFPKEILGNTEVNYIKDFGSPSRSLQRAACQARGEFLAVMSDDVIVHKNSLSDALDQLKNSGKENTSILALRYTEGVDFQANLNDFSKDYWNAYYHADLRLSGINNSWKICLMFMMKTSRFNYLGGIDCRFEHFNMNLHDMAFRNQRDGGDIIISDMIVTSHDWEPNRNIDSSYILQAHYQNDYPLFHSIYSNKITSELRPISIDINNWKNQPDKWPRKYGIL